MNKLSSATQFCKIRQQCDIHWCVKPPLPPPLQKQKPTRVRRESGTLRTKTTRTTMKMMIKKKKAKLGASFYRVSPLSPPDPGICPPTVCTAFVNTPPPFPSCSMLFLLGQDCTGPSGAALSSSPLPAEPRATQQPSTSPTCPEVLRRPSTQHSTIPLLTPRYVSCVRTLGLVSSFWVCAFNILLNEFFVLLSLFLFCLFFPHCSLFFPQ